MNESISPSSEDVRRIEQICREHDPATDSVFCEFLALIPSPEDRQFFLDYHRDELRAYVEMGLVMKKAAKLLRDYAEAGGPACITALTTLTATPPDSGWFHWADEAFLRNQESGTEIRRQELFQMLTASSPDPFFIDRMNEPFGRIMDSALDRILQDLQAV